MRGSFLLGSFIGISYCSVAYWAMHGVIIAGLLLLAGLISQDPKYTRWRFSILLHSICTGLYSGMGQAGGVFLNPLLRKIGLTIE